MQKKTLFGYLMERKWMTAEEVSAALGVQPETIEEWCTRNGAVKTETEAMQKLMNLLFEQAEPGELAAILERIAPGSTRLDSDVQREVLGKALGMEWKGTAVTVSVPAKQETQNVPIRIYLPQSNEKIPASIKAFWEVVAQTDVPSEIHIADWGSFALDEMEQSVFQYVAEQMLRAAKRGFTLHILTPETGEYQDIPVLLRRLHLYLNPRITYYRIPRGAEYPANESWMTLGMKAVLLTRVLPGEAPITTLIQEPTLAQYYYNWMQMLLIQTRPLNQHTGEGDVLHMYSRMKADVHPLMTVYFLEAAPSFLHMPPQLLREVMQDNGAEETQITECLRMSMLRASMRSICKCAQIYNGDQILHLLQQEKYTDPLLSGILGKPCYITAQQLKKQLHFFLSEVEHTNYQMFLPSFEMDLRLSQCGVSMTVQEDSMTSVIDISQRSRNFYSTDLSCVGGFAQYMEQLHRMIPPVKRSGNWTRRLLKRYIQL
ncbi:MAG: hypothetical protein IJ512_03075 [Ruminococcus sp.]|nr:hypothetical protein [Ruminococcus sp.]